MGGIRRKLRRIKLRIEILILYFLALMLFLLLMLIERLGGRVEKEKG